MTSAPGTRRKWPEKISPKEPPLKNIIMVDHMKSGELGEKVKILNCGKRGILKIVK